MPVETLKNTYTDMFPQWETMRDLADGQRAVHARGEKYLPRLAEQTTEEYNKFKGRTCFLNATGKTIDSLVGLVFRKGPDVELPAGAELFGEDISAAGISAYDLSKLALTELCTVGRYGLLVDYPRNDAGGMTVREQEASGARPAVKFYNAESIINWKTDTINGKEQLSMVVLLESVADPENNDEFDTNTTKKQYRVLDLFDGRYRQRLIDADGVETVIDVKKQGQALDFIPFQIFNVSGAGASVENPPLMDLAYLNIDHYQKTASHSNALYVAGASTLVISGESGEDVNGNAKTFRLGSTTALLLGNEAAKAYFVELKGDSLGALSEERSNLKADMATFGANLLKEQKKAAEAAETARINRAGESSWLASVASIVSKSIEWALRVALEWHGVSGDIRFELNKDYMPTVMDAQTLTALITALQAGSISFETFWYNLVRGELAPEGVTAETEQDQIEAGQFGMPGEEVA